MNVTSIPSPQEVVQTHTPLLALIVSALRSGVLHALEYADWQDEKIDRALAPSLVRKGAKRYLLAKGQAVENEEDEPPIEYEAEYLANLGLALRSEGVQIRVLRSDHGHLPIPGLSKKRQSYYAQQQSFQFEPAGGDQPSDAAIEIVNLVLHWSPDNEYNLDKVYLGCPKAGGLTRGSVEAHWDELIWRRHHGASVDGAQVEAEVADLDIHLDAEEGTGTAE